MHCTRANVSNACLGVGTGHLIAVIHYCGEIAMSDGMPVLVDGHARGCHMGGLGHKCRTVAEIVLGEKHVEKAQVTLHLSFVDEDCNGGRGLSAVVATSSSTAPVVVLRVR